jgi:GH15 family glucan-1,4-alpha-glucosidase
MDASLLLLPTFDFIDYRDDRMVRTVDRVAAELDDHGLLRRYDEQDDLEGREGMFIACTFWLVDCYAHQGRLDDARAAFDRAASTANDLGLFSEEFDAVERACLGNFPQGLTHLSHIVAAAALRDAVSAVGEG